MNPTLKRSITGIIYVATFVGSLLHPSSFIILMGLFCLGGTYEVLQMNKSNASPFTPLVLIISLLTYLQGTLNFFYNTQPLLPILITLTVLLFAIELYRGFKVFQNIGTALLSIVYVAFPLMLFVRLAFTGETYSMLLPLFILIIIWLNDSGAYCIGSWIGKRALFSAISPKKTIEGLLGGILVGLLASTLLASHFSLDTAYALAVGSLCIVGSVFGDFFESLLKRSVDIKDSGNIFPGHGGVLDRIDSLLLVAVLVWLLKSIPTIF